ncbi:MAG: TIGR01777 family oxidoreductase [Desulfomonilaceae bacterium]
MRIFMTGANGFVGTNICRNLVKEGFQVTALVRGKGKHLPGEVSRVIGESTKPGKWQESVAGYDVLINLAGASIFKRWNKEYKQLLRDSRMLTTRNLVEAIPKETGPKMALLSTSAVGYYGSRGDEELDENALAGDDFLAKLALDWENEAFKAREKGVRVVTTRFGIVLGHDGGALEQMTMPFRFFVGGPLGNGRQWFSWIHIEDLIAAALFIISRPDIDGAVNFTAPNPIRNKDLAKAMGNVMHRPSFMPAPGFMIKLLMGELGSVILNGQRVLPGVLQSKGFNFNFPDIKTALRNLLAEQGPPNQA